MQHDQKITKLQSRIDQLEAQLERNQKKSSGTTQIDDADFVKQFLSTEYRTLRKILKELVESGALDNLVRKRVEDQLYFLASQDMVEYERGWGWKLAEEGDQ